MTRRIATAAAFFSAAVLLAAAALALPDLSAQIVYGLAAAGAAAAGRWLA